MNAEVTGLIKLCGMNAPEAVEGANAAAPDYMGMVIDFPRSPRNIALEAAIELKRMSVLPVVAVVVNPEMERLTRIVAALALRAVQLSGSEDPEFVARAVDAFPDTEIWKVVHTPPLPTEVELTDVIEAGMAFVQIGVGKLMIDAAGGTMPGGTGRSVSPAAARRLVEVVSVPVILAGGLTPDNVAGAIAAARPAGVDVSGGIESTPGVKDPARMSAFVSAARAAFSDGPALRYPLDGHG